MHRYFVSVSYQCTESANIPSMGTNELTSLMSTKWFTKIITADRHHKIKQTPHKVGSWFPSRSLMKLDSQQAACQISLHQIMAAISQCAYSYQWKAYFPYYLQKYENIYKFICFEWASFFRYTLQPTVCWWIIKHFFLKLRVFELTLDQTLASHISKASFILHHVSVLYSYITGPRVGPHYFIEHQHAKVRSRTLFLHAARGVERNSRRVHCSASAGYGDVFLLARCQPAYGLFGTPISQPSWCRPAMEISRKQRGGPGMVVVQCKCDEKSAEVRIFLFFNLYDIDPNSDFLVCIALHCTFAFRISHFCTF
jgi:hypothetical protein